jgi:hypothetical protein
MTSSCSYHFDWSKHVLAAIGDVFFSDDHVLSRHSRTKGVNSFLLCLRVDVVHHLRRSVFEKLEQSNEG